MSRHTLSRLPEELLHVFRIYQNVSSHFLPASGSETLHRLRNSGPQYHMLNRAKLSGSLKTNGPVFNAADFSPLMAQIVAPLFSEPLVLEEKDVSAPQTDGTYLDRTIISDQNHSSKHFTKYQAKILSTFASYSSPLSLLPRANAALKSFYWYQKLLLNSPMIFFLKQKQSLFSESTCLGTNDSLASLKISLQKLSNTYRDSSQVDQRVRNYHLTDLATTDIFNLALLAEGKKGVDFDDLTGNSFWKGLPRDTRLSRILRETQKPVLVDERGIAQPGEILNLIPKNYPFRDLFQKLKGMDNVTEVKSIFPFDVDYNDIYLLTIERPVIMEDHTSLIELLERQKDFDIVAVRVSSSISGIGESDILEENITKDSIARFDATYEELLKWAERKHIELGMHASGIIPILQKLGHWGFVDVEESELGFTLFK